MRIKLAIMLIVVLALVSSVGAAPVPFVSPVPPWCGPGAVQPCLPWRPTPPAKEPKEIVVNRVSAEMSKRGECLARARAWGVDEARCK